jgi:hypothetical protein
MSFSFDHHPRRGGDFARFQPGGGGDGSNPCLLHMPACLPACLSVPCRVSLSPPPLPSSYRRVGEKITVLVCVCGCMPRARIRRRRRMKKALKS